jgi:hypothetical protein
MPKSASSKRNKRANKCSSAKGGSNGKGKHKGTKGKGKGERAVTMAMSALNLKAHWLAGSSSLNLKDHWGGTQGSAQRWNWVELKGVLRGGTGVELKY